MPNIYKLQQQIMRNMATSLISDQQQYSFGKPGLISMTDLYAQTPNSALDDK